MPQRAAVSGRVGILSVIGALLAASAVVLGAASPAAADVSATSCAEVKAADPAASDGAYRLVVSGTEVEIYCHDMAGTPREYIELHRTGPGQNFSSYPKYSDFDADGPGVLTTFSRIRVDLSGPTIVVDTSDLTFAESEGYVAHGNRTELPYAVARSCDDSAPGYGNIDLRGTPFAVQSDFAVGGLNSGESVDFSTDRQRVDLSVAGYCAWMAPAGAPDEAPGGWLLELALIDGPRVSEITSPSAIGRYEPGDTITIAVHFDRTVTVTGSPTLALNSGGSAVFRSGSGSDSLDFDYTVGEDDGAAVLDVDALESAQGEITDSSGDTAALALLPSPGAPGSLSASRALHIPYPTSVAITAPASPHLPAQQPVTLTAAVSGEGGALTSQVEFRHGATTLAWATPINGVASVTLPSLAAGEYTLEARYGGDQLHRASVSKPFDFRVIDQTSVSIVGGPSGPTNDDSPTFTYAGDPSADVEGFECVLTPAGETVAFTDCDAAGQTYSDLPDGEYAFSVQAVDLAGVRSAPATRTFIVDTVAPEVSITGGPSGLTSDDAATFTYDGEPTADVEGFECALALTGTAPEFTACDADGVTYSGLTDGDYTFTVRALDAAGNVSESANQDFTINTVLPSIGGDTEAAATVGEPFTYTPTIASAHPVTVTTDSDLPAGLELDPASGAITGTPVDTAGAWPITLTATNTNGSNTHTLDLTLEAGAVDTIAVEASATRVDQGDSITLNVTGIDVAGNTTPDIDPADLEVTSDVDTDVIDGLTVTFPTASPHTITVTHLPSTATDSIVIDVTPGGTDTPPTSGGGGAGAGTGTGDGQQTDHATDNRGDLPSTGTDWTLQAAIYALLALVLGVAIIALTTRRHDTDH